MRARVLQPGAPSADCGVHHRYSRFADVEGLSASLARSVAQGGEAESLPDPEAAHDFSFTMVEWQSPPHQRSGTAATPPLYRSSAASGDRLPVTAKRPVSMAVPAPPRPSETDALRPPPDADMVKYEGFSRCQCLQLSRKDTESFVRWAAERRT